MGELPWRVVWITGASTGIGRELAVQLAGRGAVVAATARSADKLEEIGANVHPYPADAGDAEEMRDVCARVERDLGPIDLAICAAGIYRPLAVADFDRANFSVTMHVNYMGVINALAELIPRMSARRNGHIAWIASVAGYRGLPKAAAYGPSKAALINLAESLKPDLESLGITVSIINPGFVATPLTAQNDFPMPFIISPSEAASRIVRGLERRHFEIAFPRRFVAILKAGRLMPYSVYFWFIRRFVLKA